MCCTHPNKFISLPQTGSNLRKQWFQIQTSSGWTILFFPSVDGRNPLPNELGSFFHYLQVFYIQTVVEFWTINSMTRFKPWRKERPDSTDVLNFKFDILMKPKQRTQTWCQNANKTCKNNYESLPVWTKPHYAFQILLTVFHYDFLSNL